MQHVFAHDGLRFNAVKGAGRTPVFFQHGLTGTADQTIEAFPNDPRFGLRTLECRGHGLSELGNEKSISIKQFAGDVAVFVEAEKTRPAVIGGISMGAAIALHLAVHRPELVKALILARPAWMFDAAPQNMKPFAQVGALLRDHPLHAAQEKFISSDTAQYLATYAPDNLASLRTLFHREPVAATSKLLLAIAHDGPDVSLAQVKAIQVPTLIIATEHDETHPMSHAVDLHKMIPGSHLSIITPKGVDKQRYLLDFQSELTRFLEVHA
jgi:pimeloyl-ACP methyl ester carboxylesterase